MLQNEEMAIQETCIAMNRALIGADEQWKEAVIEAIKYLTYTRKEFSGDDILEIVSNSENIFTNTTGALGPICRQMAKAGLIRNSGKIVRSKIPNKHGNIHIIWESCV